MSVLKKDIGAFGVFSIAIGAMISSGIFILPGFAFSRIGPLLFLSYFIAGVLALIGILSLLELITAMPKAGGDYFIINKTFGPFIGSISGFLGWFTLLLKSSFAIFGLTEILYLYLGFNQIITGLSLCVLFVGINIFGVKEATSFQSVMVIILIALMILFIFSGIPVIDKKNFEIEYFPSVNEILLTSGFIFISFGGLLKVANVSEEVKNPDKNIPLGVISSIVTVTILYVLMVIIMTGTLDADIFSKSLTPAVDASKITMGTAGFILILTASILAFFTTANAGVLAASRYPMALSRDNLIPRAWGRVNRKTGTPVLAIITTGILIFLSLLLPIEIMVKAGSTVILTSYLLTNLSVIIFRESKIINYSPSFKAPLYPWLQIFSVIIFSFFIIDLGLSAIELSLGLILVGVLSYLLYGKHHSKRESALVHLVKRIIDKQLITETIEDDLRDILIERDNIEQDKFDNLLKNAQYSDIKGHRDFYSLISAIAPDLAAEVEMPVSEIEKRFINRQEKDNTALTDFLAVPHIVIDGRDKFFLHVIRAREGIKFTENQQFVKAIFILGGSKSVRPLHLKTISAIATLVGMQDFKKKWLSAKDMTSIKNLLLLNRRKRII